MEEHQEWERRRYARPCPFCPSWRGPRSFATPIVWCIQWTSWLTYARLAVWYIPDEWRKESDPPTTTILEAARLASKRAAERKQTIPHSSIPLIVHQTWMNTKIDEWAPDLVLGVERWLEYAMAEGKEGMAYFLWLDDGCDQLITDAEPDLVDILNALPLPVERSDVFRVVVANSIGGIVSPPRTQLPPNTTSSKANPHPTVRRHRHASPPLSCQLARRPRHYPLDRPADKHRVQPRLRTNLQIHLSARPPPPRHRSRQ